MDIIEELDELAYQRGVREGIASPYEVEIWGLEIARGMATAEVDKKIEALEVAIKTAVLEGQKTVKGGLLMAVYTKGRTSWDTKALVGYAVAHPEIGAFRKMGKPSASIRKNK